MPLYAYLSLILFVMGGAMLLRWLGDPYALSLVFSPSGSNVGCLLQLVTRYPLALGLPCLTFGAFGLWNAWRMGRRIKQRWDAYAPDAAAAALRLRSNTGKAELPQPLPRRPQPVSGSIQDFTSDRPLDDARIERLWRLLLPEAVRELLQSCGEDEVFLGQADAIVQRGERTDAELIADALVVDRRWDDGRWTTEWLCVVRNGSRPRIAGGGYLEGRFATGNPRRPYRTTTLLLWTGIIPATIGYAYWGACCMVAWVPLGLLVWVHLKMRYPVDMKAQAWLLSAMALPNAMIGERKAHPAEWEALTARVQRAIARLGAMDPKVGALA